MQSQNYNLKRELEFVSFTCQHLSKYISDLKERYSIENDLSELSSITECSKESSDSPELIELRNKLLLVKLKREQIKLKRLEIAKRLIYSKKLKDEVTETINKLTYDRAQLLDRKDSLEQESNATTIKLKKYMQISALNDAFFIWYLGPYATINNFRLGNIPARPVEWAEINAAFGQAALILSIVASRAGYEFRKYGIITMGSYSKIYKVDDKKTTYSLYTDGTFSFFPKRNFNFALTGFLTCIHELGEFIRKHDPTVCLPHSIDFNDNTINKSSILLGGDDEVWTRSLKYMLTDIKWIVAWYTKHYNNYIRGIVQ